MVQEANDGAGGEGSLERIGHKRRHGLFEDSAGSFEVVDLTHTISASMPCFPGSEPPEFLELSTVSRRGYAERRISLCSHTGTHMDAPAHLLEGGRLLDEYGVDHLVGTGIALDLTGLEEPRIRLRELEPLRSGIEGRDFVLLCTGWSGRWGRADYFQGYPVLTPEAARWIAERGPKGVGVDMISVDPMDTDTFEIHRIFLEREIVIIENLTRLGALPGRSFLLCCLPLKIRNTDGAPARAVALVSNAP